MRFNDEWHWCDLGLEVGFLFGQAGLHVSPNETVDFLTSSLLLPFNVVLRPPLAAVGVHLPLVDYGNDDTASRIASTHELEMPPYPDMFYPTEVVNDLVKLPY